MASFTPNVGTRRVHGWFIPASPHPQMVPMASSPMSPSGQPWPALTPIFHPQMLSPMVPSIQMHGQSSQVPMLLMTPQQIPISTPATQVLPLAAPGQGVTFAVNNSSVGQPIAGSPMLFAPNTPHHTHQSTPKATDHTQNTPAPQVQAPLLQAHPPPQQPSSNDTHDHSHCHCDHSTSHHGSSHQPAPHHNHTHSSSSINPPQIVITPADSQSTKQQTPHVRARRQYSLTCDLSRFVAYQNSTDAARESIL